MINKTKRSIGEYDYILNSMLDYGLYLKDHEHLNHYIALYSKKKGLKQNDVIRKLMVDSYFLVEWITERAINSVKSTV